MTTAGTRSEWRDRSPSWWMTTQQLIDHLPLYLHDHLFIRVTMNIHDLHCLGSKKLSLETGEFVPGVTALPCAQLRPLQAITTDTIRVQVRLVNHNYILAGVSCIWYAWLLISINEDMRVEFGRSEPGCEMWIIHGVPYLRHHSIPLYMTQSHARNISARPEFDQHCHVAHYNAY